MSMNAALSGINAAQTDISATSHNIANVSTNGFRGSRVEFAEVYNASPYTLSNTTTGSGTQVLRVSQDFGQGNIVTTGNRLDLAIEGQGFFATRPATGAGTVGDELRFTRAGAFGMDAEGMIVNSSGYALLGRPVSADGNALNGSLSATGPIMVPRTLGQAKATTEMELNIAFPADDAMLGLQDAVPPTLAFDETNPATWARRTPVPVLDADGRNLSAHLYMIKVDSPDANDPNTTWEFRLKVEKEFQPVGTDMFGRVTFDALGDVVAGQERITFGQVGEEISLDLTGSNVTNGPFEIRTSDHNGESVSTMTGVEIDQTGTMWANYGADVRIAVSKIVMANVTNPQGLNMLSNSSFAATAASGPVFIGEPGSLGFGFVRSGALEKANIDLTEELVNLITAQRNYQASAKAMETTSSMMQTIMNIRS